MNGRRGGEKLAVSDQGLSDHSFPLHPPASLGLRRAVTPLPWSLRAHGKLKKHSLCFVPDCVLPKGWLASASSQTGPRNALPHLPHPWLTAQWHTREGSLLLSRRISYPPRPHFPGLLAVGVPASLDIATYVQTFKRRQSPAWSGDHCTPRGPWHPRSLKRRPLFHCYLSTPGEPWWQQKVMFLRQRPVHVVGIRGGDSSPRN